MISVVASHSNGLHQALGYSTAKRVRTELRRLVGSWDTVGQPGLARPWSAGMCALSFWSSRMRIMATPKFTYLHQVPYSMLSGPHGL